MYYEKYHRGWFYRTFICAHRYNGQILKDRSKGRDDKHRHYRECQKCGKRVYID
jgi:hypothetical protein